MSFWWRPRVDVNHPCPACGHRRGKIACVQAAPANGKPGAFIEHTCLVCSARFYEGTVIKAEKWQLTQGS